MMGKAGTDGQLEIPSGILTRLKRAKYASVLTGAGVSAESGVPTFRGAGGIWEKYDFRKLATPEGFWADPQTGWEWYQLRQREMIKARPNPTHEAIAEMEKHFESFHVLTQNIDGLHARAGNRNIVELHGNMWRMKCPRDGNVFDIVSPVSEIPPLCQCGSVLRPDVVWFGEPLPEGVVELAHRIASRSEVMFVVGTSAIVYPAAALPIATKSSGGLVIEVNVEPTELTPYADLSIFSPAGKAVPAIWTAISNPKGL